ncbi:MAG: septal ring lytic transglycosylase RlpA family protein [Candidatus Peregrinibacteria bacterium]|nr:septal ring lytic transglycosylase RlpA family protein [Candidatus Peregrinibacteria bacterium]
MVTAHKTLPFGTIVEVTNIANGKSVKVKVTDRGPFGAGRVLDLSKKAFAKIASPSEGVVNVEYHEYKPTPPTPTK